MTSLPKAYICLTIIIMAEIGYLMILVGVPT